MKIRVSNSLFVILVSAVLWQPVEEALKRCYTQTN
jgi:hypothetical protein